MTRLLVAYLALTSCSRTNELELYPGVTRTSISEGLYKCAEIPAAMSTIAPVLVIDYVHIGEQLSCRGEALYQFCTDDDRNNAKCTIERAGCYQLEEFRGTSRDDYKEYVAQQWANLDLETLLPLPDDYIVVRAVITTEPAIGQACSTGEAQPLRGDLALGCAYSCTMNPDEERGAVFLGVDWVGRQCDEILPICASFPGAP